MPGTPYAGNDVFPASITIPTDGDDYVAATYAPADEGNADRTRWLKNRAGDYRIVGAPGALDVVYDDSSFFTNTSWSDTVLTPAHETILTTVASAGLLVGDVLDIEFTGAIRILITTGATFNRGVLALLNNGVLIPGANSMVSTAASATDLGSPIAMRTRITIGAVANQAIGITGRIDGTGLVQVEYCGSWTLSITHYRSNA